MQNTNNYENMADAVLVIKHFQEFLNDFVAAGGTYLPEVTNNILKFFRVENDRSVMGTMIYAFTAGLNAGLGLAMAEDETKNKEG